MIYNSISATIARRIAAQILTIEQKNTFEKLKIKNRTQ
jgi:hypothetical protein